MAETHRGIFAWLQDNARILLSIALVLFLLFAVYSYSKRTDQAQIASNDTSAVDDSPANGLTLDQDVLDAAAGSDLEPVGGGPDSDDAAPGTQQETQDLATQDAPAGETKIEEQIIEQVVMNKEGVIAVAAGNGDGMTHLARRAASEYTASNNVDALSSEQRVYVEDYLRRAVPTVHVAPGTSVDFSNDAIAAAIEKARALTPAQIANLTKYAQRISEFQ